MERIDAPLSKDYPPLKLHLDDLENIAQVLADSCSAVTFETEGYRFNSIAELASEVKKTRLETVHVEAASPYITLELTKRWARLYVNSRKDKSAGIFYNLNQILSASRRSLSWLYGYTLVWVLNGVMILWNVVSLKLNLELEKHLEVVVVLIPFGWVLWVTFIRLSRHSTIILKRKKEAGSFVERNRDNLAVAVIAAILGALGTVLVTYVLK